MLTRAKAAQQSFQADEDGTITPLMVIFVLLIFAIGGVGVDYSFAIKSRTELQGAADAAAHAALYSRQSADTELARVAALSVTDNVLPSGQFGQVVEANDIQFGRWDEETRTFEIDPFSNEAVFVKASRTVEKSNAAPAFLSAVMGREHWNIQVGSVYETYFPGCLNEGFVADGVVDIRSNNSFTNGFCLHSNTYVSVSSNNLFDNGTIVSMPDKTNIDMPNSGFETNDGLYEALRDRKYNIRVLNRIEEIRAGIETGDVGFLPNYVYDTTPLSLSGTTIAGMEADAPNGNGGGGKNVYLEPNRIHTKSCNGGKSLTFSGNFTISEVVIITDCKLKFGQGVVLEDVVVLTENTNSKSVSAASGLQLGRDDECAYGGGAQLITMGSVDIPADLRMFGGQMIAKGDIAFAANANGIEGASMIAGGSISGTSNMTMGFCQTGMEGNFSVPYFRLAI